MFIIDFPLVKKDNNKFNYYFLKILKISLNNNYLIDRREG